MPNTNISDVCEILGVESGSFEKANSSDKKLSPVAEAINNAKKEKERKEKKNEKKSFKGKATCLISNKLFGLLYSTCKFQ
jgi:hypothetical protein